MFLFQHELLVGVNVTHSNNGASLPGSHWLAAKLYHEHFLYLQLTLFINDKQCGQIWHFHHKSAQMTTNFQWILFLQSKIWIILYFTRGYFTTGGKTVFTALSSLLMLKWFLGMRPLLPTTSKLKFSAQRTVCVVCTWI